MSQKRFVSEALNAHNEFRIKHQASNLELDTNLNDMAAEWADYLASKETLKYNDVKYKNDYVGENILRIKINNKFYFSGKEITDEWYKGEQEYKYDGEFNVKAGNFSQIVWKNSKKVGFGYALSEQGYFYAVAMYWPSGNIKNQFTANVSDDNKQQTNSSVSSETKPNPASLSNTLTSSGDFDKVQFKFINEALKAHNDCRSKHGVPLLWHNKELSKIAQKYAEKLAALKTLKHSPKESRVHDQKTLGENLAFAYDSTLDFYSGEKATLQWYDEIKDHNFSLDSQPGTGHFTQVIWKSTSEVGFGVAKASDGSFYAVANYSPAGNFIGQFKENVPKRIN